MVGSLERISAILTACARLHNFIIEQDLATDDVIDANVIDAAEDDLEIRPNPNAPLGMSYLPVVPDETFEPMVGISRVREATVELLREQRIGRPRHNLERKKREIREVTSTNGRMIDREYISPL